MLKCIIPLLLLPTIALAQESAPLRAPLPLPNPLPREAAPSVLDDSFSALSSAPDLGINKVIAPIPATEPMSGPPERASLLPLIRRYAVEANIPADLADAIIAIESNYDASKRGSLDEFGLMQITPAMARRNGFNGKAEELLETDTNIRLGIAYLAQSWRQAEGDLCHTLMKYRFGLQSTDLTDESKAYCKKAVIYLDTLGSSLGRTVEMPGLNRPVAASHSRFNWNEHESRIKKIDNKWGGDNFGIISP